MKIHALFGILLTLSSCSLFHEAAPGPKVINLSAGGGGSDPFQCVESIRTRVSDVSKPAKEFLNDAFATESIQCARAVVSKAFETVKGESAGRLSALELRSLQKKGVIPVLFKDDRTWDVLAGVLSLLDRDGVGAISKDAFDRFFAWGERHQTLILDYANRWVAPKEGFTAAHDWPDVVKAQTAASELFDLLSDHGEITRGQYEMAVQIIQDNFKSSDYSPWPTWRTEGMWTLRRLFIKTYGRDVFPARGLRELLKMFVGMTSDLGSLVQWREDFWNNPLAVSEESRAQMPLAEARLKTYFDGDGFTPLEPGEFRNLVSSFVGRQVTQSFSDQVFGLLKRWGATPDGRLHPRVVSVALSDFSPAMTELAQAGSEMGCTGGRECAKAKGQVTEATPLLFRHTHKAGFFWEDRYDVVISPDSHSTTYTLTKKRLYPREQLIRAVQIANSIQNEHWVKKIFALFDADGDGKMPYDSKDVSKTRDAFDLAATALGLAREAGNSPDKPVADGPEAPPAASVTPEVVYKMAGFYADVLMPDGDRDGSLNVHELHSVGDFLNRVQELTSNGAGFFGFKFGYSKFLQFSTYWDAQNEGALVLPRAQVVQDMWTTTSELLSYQYDEWSEVKSETREKIAGGLLGPSTFEGKAYRLNPLPMTLEDLKEAVTPDQLTAWSAFSVMVDRIWLQCDVDGDKVLSPDEQFRLGDLFTTGLQAAVDAGLVEPNFMVKLILKRKNDKKFIRSVIQMLAFKEGSMTGIGDVLSVLNPLSDVKPLKVRNLFVIASKFI